RDGATPVPPTPTPQPRRSPDQQIERPSHEALDVIDPDAMPQLHHPLPVDELEEDLRDESRTSQDALRDDANIIRELGIENSGAQDLLEYETGLDIDPHDPLQLDEDQDVHDDDDDDVTMDAHQ